MYQDRIDELRGKDISGIAQVIKNEQVSEKVTKKKS